MHKSDYQETIKEISYIARRYKPHIKFKNISIKVHILLGRHYAISNKTLALHCYDIVT
jgi:hypothetical protein